MPSPVTQQTSFSFLQGTGEMVTLIAAKDWSQTPVGDVRDWPQSLRTTLSIILNSKFPMFLWWGPELTCFYNDSYRPSLGIDGKHPSILGMSARDAWPEIWHIIKPLIDQVLLGGEATWSDDQLIPIYRNGKIEDVYWTFSYSPVRDETEKVAGVLVICSETTMKVLSLKKVEESQKEFRNTVMQAPVGITILRGENFMVEMANTNYLQVIGKTEDEFVGRSLFDSLPEVRSNVEPLLQAVLQTGQEYRGMEFEIFINRYGVKEKAFFNFVYQPLIQDDGSVGGIIVVATEVTKQVEAKHRLLESERQFSHIVMESPFAMTIVRGNDFIIEIANHVMFNKIWRKTREDTIGKSILDVFPELKDQKYPALLNKVLDTGQTYHESESVAHITGDDGLKKFYLDFEYSPLFQHDGKVSGIMITVNDVTEKVEARQKIEENEKKLNIVIEASGLGTWELDLVTGEVTYSGRYLEILGYNEKVKLTHSQILSHLHPDDMPVRQKAFQEAFVSGMLQYESRIIWNDNTQHWVEGNGKVFYDETGKPVRLMGTLRDITDEKNHQHELEEREKKFRLLADFMPQFVWTSNAEGIISYFSKGVYEYTRMSEDQLISGGWIEVVHPADREETRKAWCHSIATGEPFLFEHRFKRYDGEYSWQLSRALPVKDTSGNTQMWIGTSTDIDEIKKHEKEKDDFIKIASHELKTPVTTIKAYVQLLLKQEFAGNNPLLSQSLFTINKQITKLVKLITDLLDLTKIELGSIDPVNDVFCIDDLVKDVVHNLQATTHTHRLVIEPSANYMVLADRDRISQVIANLLTNAIKYSPEADRVIIEIKAADDMVVVSCRDFGIGVSYNDFDKIFHRFYRVESTAGKIIPGFGIGLFIVKEIVSSHKGKVWVESEMNKGSVFHFSLPMHKI